MAKTISRLFGMEVIATRLIQVKPAVSKMLCIRHRPQQTQKRARVGIPCHETTGYGQMQQEK